MKVLIVEENPGLRRLLRSLLAANGDEIRECEEGAEAVSFCALEQPDWVVLDLNLARADALSVTRQMRAACPQVRVLLVADEDDARLRSSAAQAGATRLVGKENLLEIAALLRAA
ncbi:MAG: response regulator [Blastocatellia bacterium]